MVSSLNFSVATCIVLCALVLSSNCLSSVDTSNSLHSYLIVFVYSVNVATAATQTVQGQNHVIYVTPGDDDSLCPKNSSPCHTLDWYSKTESNGSFIMDNTEVRFLEGVHLLKSWIQIENHSNISLIGLESSLPNDSNGMPQPISWIKCDTGTLNDNGFRFLNTSYVQVKNLGFHSCGTIVMFCKSKVSAALVFHQGINVLLSQVIINESRGIGLHLSNVFGSISIDGSVLTRTSSAKLSKWLPRNARIWFGRTRCFTSEDCSEQANVTISSSWFTDGQNDANGLEIIVYCPNVHVLITDVTIRNNRGRKGGNLALSVTDFSRVTKTSNIIKIKNSQISEGKAHKGGGMRFWTRTNYSNIRLYDCSFNNTHTILDVYNTNFSSNQAILTGGAIIMSHYQRGGYSCAVKNVAFRDCFFLDNFGNKSVVEISKHLILTEHASPPLHVRFEHCDFHNNSASNTKGRIMNIFMTHVVMLECFFHGNIGTAISMQASKLNVYNGIYFENNIAEYGAAMKVCDGSLIFLNVNSHVHFINNRAKMGGAVFVQQACIDTPPACFFQPAVYSKNISEYYLELEFINNSAEIAGDAIYGGSIDNCYTIKKYSYPSGRSMKFLHIFKEIFDMEKQTGPSWVTSDPRGVCFCSKNGTSPSHYFCPTTHSVIDVYPGESFSVTAVIVGQLNGTSSGMILAELVGHNNSHKLISHNDRNASNECVDMTYTLLSNQSRATVVLQPSIKMYSESFNASFTVKFLPCPMGFQLLQEDGEYKCRCSTLFHKFLGHSAQSIECDINTKTISLKDHWIGCQVLKNQSACSQDSLIVSDYCGDYCIDNGRNVSILDGQIDSDQCIPGRTGILCGACKRGFSYSFNALSKCKKCSDNKLLVYVILFLLSGILLIAALTVLNITVTEGTTNGLIFYATVMYGNQNLFPDDSTFGRSLRTFIQGLNLEPGHIGCLYHGMTAYQYIWLKFVAIFYLLLLQFIIIYLSHRFTFFTRLLGKNVLKVLATLLFLGHSQLLFACYQTFWFDKIYRSSTGKVALVWHLDGTVPYLGPKHAPLFVVALFCFLVAAFFIFSLLCIQCLQRWSSYCCLCWVERFRPFFEVYTGPCNDSYRFWPGLLFVLRSGIYAINTYFSRYKKHLRDIKMTSTSSICILVMSLACIFPHSIYKKWCLNVLEFFFLLNICLTSLLLGFLPNPARAIYYSVTPVIVVFSGILLYHIQQQIKGTCLWKVIFKWVTACKKKFYKRKYSSPSREDEELLLPQPFPKVVKVNECREPLLED